MSTMATNLASGAPSESRSALRSTSKKKKIRETTKCISQFFRPIGKKGTSRLDMQEKNNVIILDDDSDGELDGEEIDTLNLTGAENSIRNLNDRSQAIEIYKHDTQSSLSLEKTNSRKCWEDIVQSDSSHCDRGVRNYSPEQHCISNAKEVESSPQTSSPSPIVKKSNHNPFAKFAHVEPPISGSRGLNDQNIISHPLSLSSRNKKRRNSTKNNESENFSVCHSKKIHNSLTHDRRKGKEFIKICDISPREQIKIIRKWHSMADPLAPLEVRRFQILLAARLHARCQEITVRKAMKKLREYFSSRSETKTITVAEIAKSDPQELAIHISSLQFYNAKAKQIVKAAQEIQSRHGGLVPEDEYSLLQITGIGKTFADLLAFVNKRETHEDLARHRS